jgi:hypothetical protein
MRLGGKVALVTGAGQGGTTLHVDGGLLWDYTGKRVRTDGHSDD